MLTYEFQVSLPVLARHTFHGSSEVYGFMTAAMGIGAVDRRPLSRRPGARPASGPLVIAATGFGGVTLLAALGPDLALELVALAFVGWGSVAFLALGNSTLQLNSDPSMRGRVMALWAVAFLGSTPIGGPTIGWVIRVLQSRGRSGWSGRSPASSPPVSAPSLGGGSSPAGRCADGYRDASTRRPVDPFTADGEQPAEPPSSETTPARDEMAMALNVLGEELQLCSLGPVDRLLPRWLLQHWCG